MAATEESEEETVKRQVLDTPGLKKLIAKVKKGDADNAAMIEEIAALANKVEASQTNGNIKIDGTETNVYTHPTSGAGVSKGDTTAQTPGFGGTFKVLSATVDSMGHTTALGEHTVTIPYATATPSTDGVGGSAGLMSASDKEKLDDLNNGVVTDIKYVANQSGGGGALKKTVNGADVSVLEFMTTAEAQQLLADAKAEVNNR